MLRWNLIKNKNWALREGKITLLTCTCTSSVYVVSEFHTNGIVNTLHVTKGIVNAFHVLRGNLLEKKSGFQRRKKCVYIIYVHTVFIFQ